MPMAERRLNVDRAYFTWLYSQIGAVTDRNPSHSHWSLAEQMHRMPFLWTVPNDDNRAEDGASLREEYVDIHHGEYEIGACSVLEMLIALSRRLEFEAGGVVTPNSTGEWFWLLGKNLGLTRYTDEVYASHENTHEDVAVILDELVYRKYHRTGRGGLFPLRHPLEDQRDTELWNQMSAYLLENDNLWL